MEAGFELELSRFPRLVESKMFSSVVVCDVENIYNNEGFFIIIILLFLNLVSA